MNEIRKAGKCRSIDFFVLEYNKKRHKEVQTFMLKWLLTGGLIPPILLVAGAFFLFYLRGYPWRAPRRMLSAFVGEKKGEGTSSFRAMMLALAGTLGVGNIVGVANGYPLDTGDGFQSGQVGALAGDGEAVHDHLITADDGHIVGTFLDGGSHDRLLLLDGVGDPAVLAGDPGGLLGGDIVCVLFFLLE